MLTPRERRLGDALRPLDDDRDLDALLDAIGDARYVLLGEASHGTHEFYTWRARLSRRLIAEMGFTFIGVEGDWPDCYELNRFVKGRSPSTSAFEALTAFRRWPTWMWANREIATLATWLRLHNDALPLEERAGFYGFDVYSLWASLARVLEYLAARDGAAALAAAEAFRCFEPYFGDEHEYARATALVPASCEEEVVTLLSEVHGRQPHASEEVEDRFSLEQDARAAVGAERYYRTMVRGDRESWNHRDSHMVDTLDRLVEHHGRAAKAIVWAHNTHIGDARATPMGAAGMHNVGQLVRERHADDGVYIVGFSSHRGHVVAGPSWGAPMQRMVVPPARSGSIDDLLHAGAGRNGILFLDEVAAECGGRIDHRAIGVVYRPALDGVSNYVPSLLPKRYDALVHVDEAEAVDAFGLPALPGEAPETYPFGV